MKEAIGGAWLTIIVIFFITIFTGYLAFSINYSKAFRVKDGIVERIEKHNGFNTESLDDIDDYINEIGYKASGSCKNFAGKSIAGDTSSEDATVPYAGITDKRVKINPSSNENYNYCVQRVAQYFTSSVNVMRSAYYKVIVFFSLSIGSINLFSNFNVTGETITLYYPTDNIFK